MKGRMKKIVVTTGLLSLMLLGGPIVQNNPLGAYMGSMTTYAAEQTQTLPYSTRWETQADGSWRYKLDAGGYATGWIQDEVDKQWYYMDANGIMQSGVYKSYNRYYLLSQNHDGHFGHLVTNGESYNGITISADTSEAYKGALTESSLNALRSAGVNVDNVQDISGSQHVTDGKVTTPSQNTGNQGGSTGGGTQIIIDHGGKEITSSGSDVRLH